MPTPTKMADISAPSNNAKTSLLKSANTDSPFFQFVYLCGRYWKIKAQNQNFSPNFEF